jgi:hypothetical protein
VKDRPSWVGIVLKNFTSLLVAIFESRQSAQYLVIALLYNSTNQSFAISRSHDFFNNIGGEPVIRTRSLCKLTVCFASVAPEGDLTRDLPVTLNAEFAGRSGRESLPGYAPKAHH